MTQLTKDDLKQVLKEVGVVTKNDLKKMGAVTEYNLKQVLKDFGVVTKKDLNQTKKELIKRISNIALSSPTINQFGELEKRVSNLEVFAN